MLLRVTQYELKDNMMLSKILQSSARLDTDNTDLNRYPFNPFKSVLSKF